MEFELHYGQHGTARLNLRDETLVAMGRPAVDEEPLDVQSRVRQALARPLDYPPLELALAPGDRVAIVPDGGLPDAAEIIAGVVMELVLGGVEPRDISVLEPATELPHGEIDYHRLLPPDIGGEIQHVRHDPSDHSSMALLAHTEEGDAVVLNRTLVDVDVVLPIGLFHGRLLPDYHGLHTPLFPRFSDEASGRPFRSHKLLDTRGRNSRRLAKLVEQVAWLLGLVFTIQVIPGPRGHVRHVVAGHVDAVRAECNRLYRRLWQTEVPRRAGLVVTSIEGDASHQTWAALARTLTMARHVVEPRGAIVVCCELEGSPTGHGLQMMQSAPSREEALAWIESEEPADALSALQIAEAADYASVYLMSRLDGELVEQLDMIPVADVEELNRLAGRFDSCIVLESGPVATAVLAGDAPG